MQISQELALLNSFEKDNKWLNEHYEEVQKSHPNEFVAIENAKIIGSGKVVDKLVEELRSKKVKVETILIEFVPRKGLKIIL